MNEIKLQTFDDNFADYFDAEKEAYVIYAGKSGDDFNIPTQATIIDDNNTSWNCYLFAAEYVPTIDAYELLYKVY